MFWEKMSLWFAEFWLYCWVCSAVHLSFWDFWSFFGCSLHFIRVEYLGKSQKNLFLGSIVWSFGKSGRDFLNFGSNVDLFQCIFVGLFGFWELWAFLFLFGCSLHFVCVEFLKNVVLEWIFGGKCCWHLLKFSCIAEFAQCISVGHLSFW